MTNVFKDSFDFPGICKIDNLYFLNEVETENAEDLNKKMLQIQNILNDSGRYELFLKQKTRRPMQDIYACFQPFNEATKALLPFLKKLKTEVEDGDYILNLWDRSGWITNLLAGLFPKQKIITTWEGNKDVLGYRGFHFWTKNLKNVEILFCDLNNPLPFKDKSIKFSIGFDALHRFDFKSLIQELDRIVVENGSIIFPHVHLANAEPIPYFQRGGTLIHGLKYQEELDALFIHSTRKSFVFSEPKLFEANDILKSNQIAFKSNPNTEDYNGLIAILPKHWNENSLSAFSLKDVQNIGESRIIVNLLLEIDLNFQEVNINLEKFNGQIGHLLERHPIYVERITRLNGYKLSEIEAKIIYLAQLAYTCNQVSEKLKIPLNELNIILEKLEEIGLLQVLPLTDAGIRLQYFLMTQKYIVPKEEQNLKCLWYKTVNLFPKNNALISIEDQSEITYEDCNEIIENIKKALQNEKLKKGDKIIISSRQHVESVLLFWAAMQLGIVVVPIGVHLDEKTFSHILEITDAKCLFLSQDVFQEKTSFIKNIKTILFDNQNEMEQDEAIYFSEWVEEDFEEVEQEIIINETDNAVILFTSGSSGTPKGVQLSQGNLYRSALLISENFQWKEIDIFFALGGLDSMSGLRNSAISALHVGACVAIPSENTTDNLFEITDAISKSKSTIVGANPALLRNLVQFKERIGNDLQKVKTFICTGNKLSDNLRTDFKKIYKADILNYYGLSETTGICTAQNILSDEIDIDTIGLPIGCIAQIVDDNKKLKSKEENGELRIFSENLMQGYFNNEKLTAEVIENGWFYTQDIASFYKNNQIKLINRKRNIIKTTHEEIVNLDEINSLILEIDFVKEAFICPYFEEDIEKISSYVVLKNFSESLKTEDDFKKEISNKITSILGKQKVPNKILIVEQLPYSDNGKIILNKLTNEL